LGIPADVCFHTLRGLRLPLGIYNVSIQRVSEKLIAFCGRLECQSKECSVFDGREAPNTLIDVCAKLKYVRSIAVGANTNFSCPRDISSLVGLTAIRIRSIWGEPDFVDGAALPNRVESGTRWTYFIGSPKPEQEGGGFPELSIRLVDGSVKSVSCALSM
jgi:hypothetical protein